MLLLWSAIGLLSLASLAGLWLARRMLAKQLPPWRASIAHGGLAIAGLVLLLLQADRGRFDQSAALLLLMLAVATGMALLSLHLLQKPSHLLLILLHALLALAGLAAVLVSVL